MENLKHSRLSQLLPYDTGMIKNGCLRKGLNEYQAILRASIEAVDALKKREIDKFDCLVGENACQIRAVWMPILVSSCFANSTNLCTQISNVLNSIDLLLAPKELASLMNKNDSFKDVLVIKELDIHLTQEEMLLIQSYFLYVMRSRDEVTTTSLFTNDFAEPKKLLHLGDISTSFARNLLSKLRRSLATHSVEFVREKAALFECKTLNKMVSQEFTIEHNTLPCIPMFWTYKTIIATAQKEKMPLVIHVKLLEETAKGYNQTDEEYLFYTCSHGGEYIETDPQDIDASESVWVIQGVAASDTEGQYLTKAQWKAAITKRSIEDVILAGAADHRQYPDPMHDHRVTGLEDSEFKHYKALAKKQGYSHENPNTFFIQHVYASQSGNILRTLRKSECNSSISSIERIDLGDCKPFAFEIKQEGMI